MKYLFILVLLVPNILAEEKIQIKNEESKIEAANHFPINIVSRMRYSTMGNGIDLPQQAIQYYNLMKDQDFPIDYSLSCSNTCNCRTVCVMYWWIPCTCACPPPCNNNNNNNQDNQNVNRFPPIEWEPETQPPRFPNFPRLTTTTPQPIWNGNPWNPIPPRWPSPEWIDPKNPNNHPTHPPQQRNTPSPWNPQPIAPPIWIDRNPNNPNNFPTHPPNTTPPPVWWNQRPNNPIIPLPEPIPNPNWWEQQPKTIEPPCDNTCSCVPCTVIWVCPPACSASCCAARGFGNAENVDRAEGVQQAAEPQRQI